MSDQSVTVYHCLSCGIDWPDTKALYGHPCATAKLPESGATTPRACYCAPNRWCDACVAPILAARDRYHLALKRCLTFFAENAEAAKEAGDMRQAAGLTFGKVLVEDALNGKD
jgi:hypothetical protein